MADDRNLTVHAYKKALAERIFSRLQAYAATMIRFLDAIERRGQAA